MIIKNVRVYTEDQQFTDGEIVIRDGMICLLYTSPSPRDA